MNNEEKRLADELVLNELQGEGPRMINIMPKGYLKREDRENRREDGLPDGGRDNGRNAFWDSDLEYVLRRSDRLMSQLENERVADPSKDQQWGKDEEDFVYDSVAREWVAEWILELREKERQVEALNIDYYRRNGKYANGYIKKALRKMNSRYQY